MSPSVSLGGPQSLPSSQCLGSCFVSSGIISIARESGCTVGNLKNCAVPSGGAGVSRVGLCSGLLLAVGRSQFLYIPPCHGYCHYSCLFPCQGSEGFPPPAPDISAASQAHLEPLAAPFLVVGALSKPSWGSSLAFPAPLTASHRWDVGWESDAPLHVPGTESLHRDSQRVLPSKA